MARSSLTKVLASPSLLFDHVRRGPLHPKFVRAQLLMLLRKIFDLLWLEDALKLLFSLAPKWSLKSPATSHGILKLLATVLRFSHSWSLHL
ncbi:hypothetical protein LguiA_019148 [Lonicera macranthoides]